MKKIKIKDIKNINETGVVYRIESKDLITKLVENYNSGIRRYDYLSITFNNQLYDICYGDRFEPSSRDRNTSNIKKNDIENFEITLIGKQYL